MQASDEVHSWFGPSLLETSPEPPAPTSTQAERLWRGFMTARVTLGLVLLLAYVGSRFVIEVVLERSA